PGASMSGGAASAMPSEPASVSPAATRPAVTTIRAFMRGSSLGWPARRRHAGNAQNRASLEVSDQRLHRRERGEARGFGAQDARPEPEPAEAGGAERGKIVRRKPAFGTDRERRMRARGKFARREVAFGIQREAKAGAFVERGGPVGELHR